MILGSDRIDDALVIRRPLKAGKTFAQWAVTLMLVLTAPAQAIGTTDDYPLQGEVRAFKELPLGVTAVQRVAKDFQTRRAEVQRAGGQALAKTDTGYGAKFRVRYHLHGAYIDEYSGIFDGWMSEWHFRPMRFEEALQLARSVDKGDKGGLHVDFSRPTRKTATEITYESTGEGCMASMTFKLDASGCCYEIIQGGAC